MTDFARHREAAERQRRATEEAAGWYLDQQEGLDESQQQAFTAWLRESPLHVTEYLAMAHLHGDLGAASAMDPLSEKQLCELAAGDTSVVPLNVPRVPEPAPTLTPRRRRMAWLAQAVAAVVVAAIGGAAWMASPPPPWESYASEGNAVRSATLPDGTAVQMDRDSIVAVSMCPTQRRIDVLRGGALFDVAHDPARPLRVRLGANELQDIGTVFDAHYADDGGRVTVISGKVKVWQRDQARWSADATTTDRSPLTELTAGQEATMHVDGSLDLVDRHADLASSTHWLPADIHFERASVANVARRFNAYSSHPLLIEDAGIGATLISGRFHARDMDSFVAYLLTLPDVQVIRGPDDVRIVRAPMAHTQAVRKNS
ncbi:FecR domain-containing protein [Dyella sp. C11]|uniref:FecR domain-containing protein n=1 Tax=Dyella sp. C11 TaxID=2126991 RepID=UPI000D653AD0|nr:FecR domain-containing protein [Dyella sp. C11]